MSFTLRTIQRQLAIRSGSVSGTRLFPSSHRLVHQSTPPSPSQKPSRATDPYPLPLSDPSLASLSSGVPNLDRLEEDFPMPAPLDRTGEDEETLRARLVYQTRKRGTLEADLILATFAKDQLGSMSVEQLREFDKLLDEPDWDIYYWSIGKREPPARWAGTPLLEALKRHAKNEGRVVRSMPELKGRGGL